MKYYKYVMDMKVFNILSIFLFFPLFIIIYLLGLSTKIDLYFLVYYFLWMFLHEILHGIGFLLNKNIDESNVVFGVCLEKGILYCMCKQEIGKKQIIISLLFPFIFIGVVTFFVGIILNNSMLQLLSLFNIVGCIGDLFMFFFFVRLPDFSYVDLDDCTGFVLVSNNDLKRYKFIGLKCIESGDYKNLGKASNFKRINVSKFSYVVFFVIFVFLILDFFV